MADIKRSVYNIALAGQGYVLYGTPGTTTKKFALARQMAQAPIFGSRFAQGDNTYQDFTFWWYWAQTDWANGFKDTLSWLDDAKYYYSTNIDAFSEYGSIKLASGLVAKNTFTENIYCGCYGKTLDGTFHFIGTDGNTETGKPQVYYSEDGVTFYNYSDLNDIYPWMSSARQYITLLRVINNNLWIGTAGTLDTSNHGLLMERQYGGNLVDHTSDIQTVAIFNGYYSVLAMANLGNVVYLFYGGDDSVEWLLLSYDGSTWTKIAGVYDGTTVFDAIEYGGNIFYLSGVIGGKVNLMKYDITLNTSILIQSFNNDYFRTLGGCGRYLHILNGNLIITIPSKEIWGYNGSTISRIWKADKTKIGIGGEAVGDINNGGITHDNKIWWSNLVYDGTYFYNNKKDIEDTAANPLVPLYEISTEIFWWSDSHHHDLYADSGYKGQVDKNFLVFSEIDKISTINKLFNACNLGFKPLVANQSISIEYSTDEMDTWNVLGSVSYDIDGGSIVMKTLLFPDNTIARKMWVRAKLNGDTTTTPTLQDISTTYYPVPEYKGRWIMNLNCIDNLILLDGKTYETKRGEELRNILKIAWKNKESVNFQDVDYAETKLNYGETETLGAEMVANGGFDGNADGWNILNCGIQSEESLGEEMITDGNFSIDPSIEGVWVFDEMWHWDSENFNMYFHGANGSLSQNIGATQGTNYQISIDFGASSGSVYVSIGEDSNYTQMFFPAGGVNILNITAGGSDGFIYIHGIDPNSEDIILDDVSVKEVISGGCISGAWEYQNNQMIYNTYPEGELLQDVFSQNIFKNDPTAHKYRISIEVGGENGQVKVDLVGNNNTNTHTINAGSGVITYDVDLEEEATGLYIRSTNSDFDGYVDNISVKKIISESELNASDTTITVLSTDSFPEQGIIRIENEKIKYNGKGATSFLNCIRGYEGTVATTHATDTLVDNGYKVIIIDYKERTFVGAKPKINEFIVYVDLIEI